MIEELRVQIFGKSERSFHAPNKKQKVEIDLNLVDTQICKIESAFKSFLKDIYWSKYADMLPNKLEKIKRLRDHKQFGSSGEKNANEKIQERMNAHL